MKSLVVFLYICLGLSVTTHGLPTNTTGKENPESRIVGGTATSPFQYPWLALLTYSSTNQNDRFRRHCGGSLIHPNYVLTAAHCTYQSNIYVVLNRFDLSDAAENSQRFSIKQIFRHPKYNYAREDSQYDIALLKLNGNSTIKPVSLGSPKSENMTLPDTLLSVAGWGTMRYGSSQLPDKLQQVDVPVVSTKDCQSYYAGYPISTLQICAGDTVNGGEDSCQGDSGGPLFYKKKQPCVVGIVSYGIGCADSRYPGVYTNVIEMLSWITSIVPESELSLDTQASGGSLPVHPSALLITLLSSLLLSRFFD